MKKQYLKPQAELIRIEAADLCAASPEYGGNGNGITPEAKRNTSWDDEF